MKPQDFEPLFRQTLSDLRLSRGERKALGELLEDLDPDAEERAALLGRAFAAAEEHFDQEGRQVLGWLESVVKLISSPRAGKPTDDGVAEVLFAPEDDCARRLASLIDGARQSLQVAVFTITDNSLSKRLLAAHERGVSVRILTDDDKAQDLGSDIHRLSQAGVPVRTDKAPEHMHHKFAVFDQRLLVTGSYNWTRGAAHHNQENIVLIDDPRLVGPFRDEFERLWQEFAFED